MKAVVFNEFGGSEVLKIEEREIPEIGENEVLIKTASAGINRPDAFQRMGKYPAPEGCVQDILGLDVSGTVVKTGSKVKEWKAGDKLMALLPGGGYAEYVKADAGSCLPVPQGISLSDAAALPEVLFTVWHNLFQRGGLKKGEDILIYGGSGGIGSMAIQLVHLFGANAYTLASTPEKQQYCKNLGAIKAVDYRKDLISAFGKNSFDLILDSFGGKYLDINLDLLRPDGRLVYINAMQGVKTEINILKLMVKRLLLTGSTLRARSFEFKKELRDEIRLLAFPLLENPAFQNPVSKRFSYKDAVEAHQLMESRDFTGKIILEFS